MKKMCKRKIWSTTINPITHAIAGARVTDQGLLDKLRMRELSAFDSMVKGWGTVDMTVGEGGLIGMCKCIPIVPTAAQIDAAQGLGGGTTGAPLAGDAHGTLLSSLGADLPLTAGAHSVVLKGAGITESGSVFGIEPLRNGELAFETTRGFAANVPNATAAIS